MRTTLQQRGSSAASHAACSSSSGSSARRRPAAARSAASASAAMSRSSAAAAAAPRACGALVVPPLQQQQQQPMHQQQRPLLAPRTQQHHQRSAGAGGRGGRRGVVARANVDEPELQELVQELRAMTPDPPAERPMLDRAIALIDAANAEDPTVVDVGGGEGRVPYRLAYSRWLTEWVKRVDPKASDELLILARGRSIQSWKLADIKRDDYAPNTPGQRQWEVDRKKWLSNRLLKVVREAGYDEQSQRLVEDVMMGGRGLPDPRDMRKHDLVGALGMVNFTLLRAVMIVQTLDDAEALLFLERNFDELLNRMPADEVAAVCKRELSRLSQAGVATVLRQRWSPVQQRLLQKALPVPRKFSTLMMAAEGMAAASTHPGDWRYANFDYD